MTLNHNSLLVWKGRNFLHQVQSLLQERGSYVSSYDALLGHHKDEADEDGWAQHADSAYEGVSSLCLLAAQACGSRSDDHAQQPCHTGDTPEDQTSPENRDEGK